MGDFGSGAKGAASGAATGAAFGPWGAAIGGIAGGLYGYFGGDSNAADGMPKTNPNQAYADAYYKKFLDRGAPMMDAAQSNQVRLQQGQLAGMLQRTANGSQVGAGEMAADRQIGNATAQQTAQASMARGADAALAARQAARMQADIGVTGAGVAAQSRMGDQSNAQSQLSSLLGQQRQQDIMTAQGNQQAQMSQQQLQLQGLSGLLGYDQSGMDQDLKARQLRFQDKGIWPGLMQAGGQIGAAYAAGQGKGGGQPGTGQTGDSGSGGQGYGGTPMPYYNGPDGSLASMPGIQTPRGW